MSQFKQFVIQYNQYFAGNVATLLVGLISFPILTRFLTQEQYGVLGFVSTTMSFVVAIAKGGLSDGIIRGWRQYDGTQERRAVFSSTVLAWGFLMSLLGVGLYTVSSDILLRGVGIDAKYRQLFLIMAIYVFIRPLNIIVFNFLRADGRAIHLNLASFASKLVGTLLSLVLLMYVLKDLKGYFIGQIITEALLSIALMIWFFNNRSFSRHSISNKLAGQLIIFGAPLLLSEFSYLLISYADRYVIVPYLGIQVLGIYTVGYNLAMYIANLVVFPLSYTIIPIYVTIYEREGRKATEEFLSKCLHYIIMGIVPLFGGYYLVIRDLLAVLASSKYEAAATFSPLIVIGTVMLGLNNVFNAGLYLNKRSGTMMVIMLTVAGVNIGLNLFLVPRYGLMGAALSTLVACLISVILTLRLSSRYLTLRVDARALMYSLVITGVMVMLVREIRISNAFISLTTKVFAGAALVLAGFLCTQHDDRNKVFNILKLRRQTK